MIYLDASVIVPMFVAEARSGDAEKIAAKGGLIVSDLADVEVSSAISMRVRIGNLSALQAEQILLDIGAWQAGQTEEAEVLREDFQIASMLIRNFASKLRAPDALHIAIAMRLDAELATFDERMAAAAKGLGVPVAT